jgi:hypothetical protein
MGEATITTDHAAIRHWIETRGGRPAVADDPGSGEGPVVLRVDFPDRGDDPAMRPVDWDTFFACFEAERLAFLLQDRTADGKVSRYFRFVARVD